MILRIILYVVIAVTCILFFYFVRRERVFENTIQGVYGELNEASSKRIRQAKVNVFAQFKGFERKRNHLVDFTNRLFIYSRIGNLFSGMSFEVWTVIILIIAAGVYFVTYTITGSVFNACVAAGADILIILGIEKGMAFRNYKLVDNNLIRFLDILGNFNASSGEIMSILLQTSRYLPEPLHSVLEECYYDAQTCGDKTSALYAMANKIEHPKFKEIVCNIEICEKYTANYAVALNQSRKIVLEEQRHMRERKEIAREKSFMMLFISAALLGALFIVDGIIQRSIWELIFHSIPGYIFLGVIAAIYIYFYYKMLMVER